MTARRRLIGVVVVLAVMVAVLVVVDVVARHRVQTLVARHLETQVPGATATVRITSFPFLGRLATSGSIPELDAHLSDVAVGGFVFDTVNVAVRDLTFDTSQLYHRRIVLQRIGSGRVTAHLTQASIDQLTGLPITLGAGTVTVGGVSIRASVAISGTTITLEAAPIPPITVTLPALSFLPCLKSVVIEPGGLQLSCSITTVPAALAGLSAPF